MKRHLLERLSASMVNNLLCAVLMGLVALGTGGCAGETKQRMAAHSNTLTGMPSASSPSTVEPLTADTEEVFEEFGYDPFEEPESEKIEEYDPWESYNVVAFEFNYQFDKYILKPVAKGYNFLMPTEVQRSISNVFQNLRSAPRFFNNIFQGKFKGAGIELGRFLVNSTLGVGGLFDPAGIMFDMNTPLEDMGQTLGSYGTPPGPYLVLPFLGSFTARDAVGFVGDTFIDPVNWLVLPIIEIADAPRLVQHDDTITFTQAGMKVGETINLRSLNLEKFQGVEEGTLDLYGAVRNGYLQQRLKEIRR
ncbi:MAG: ABC transporter [Nitrospirales bacterium]|nr:MAG: ABC transporter [Nitrospirales bacterium]